ncbi:MAG TPA: choice-of-anchor D domain-containing protein, partial [Bacteroidota bacterium]
MKTLLAIGIVFSSLLSPLPSRAQEDRKDAPQDVSVSPPSSEAGEDLAAAANRGAFSVNSKTDLIGNVPVGSSKTDTVTVTNTGKATLTISSVKSSNVRFTVSPANASIAVNANKKFTITFVPATTGAQTSFIVFTHDGPTSPDTVTASGTGTAPAFSVNRKTVPFGSVVIATGKPDSVSVTNTGTAALVISSVTSTNTRFTVNPAAGTIQPGAKSTFRVTFTPTLNGVQNGNIVFVHNAPTARDTVAVSGTGTGFSVDRRSLAFGSVPVAVPTRDSVIVTNAGPTTLTISTVTSSNGAFTVSPAGASIAAAASAKFYITFTAVNTAAQTGNVVFTHNASSSPDTVAVSGSGTLPGFALSRKTVPFGLVPLGQNRLDSVVVTNTGATTLTIISVTSSNGAFTVSPAGASIAAAANAKFYITFTPTNTILQTGNVVFAHNASSSPDTVTVSGTGGAGGFAVTRRSVPFGTVALGGSKLDSVVVTDIGGVALVIGSVTSSNGTFTVNPANATLQPAQARTFYITFTPANTAAQTWNVVFTHNASSSPDTVAVSGTGVATLSAPVLLSPASGSTGQALPIALTWASVNGATGYWLEMATDPSFSMIVINDPTLVSTGRQVNGLPQNTQYYWRVSTLNAAGSGLFSPAWTLTMLSSGPVSGTISFSGDLSSTSYRMFGMPGVGTRRVGDILSGTQKTDWRMLRDNGKDTTYPAYYVDLTADSTLKTGEGYWLLQRKDLNISRTDTLPPLAPDGTYGIALHRGWNMISNPFNTSVQRTAVIAANGLPAGTLFWEQVGATRTSSGTTFDPFKGYYFYNDTVVLATLKIPYPFGTTVAKLAKAPGVDWRVELVFDSDINTDRDNYIGIAPSVGPGRNELDQHEAPLVFDQGFLYFVRPEWDPVHTRFATDMRPGLGAGQTWDFEVWNPRNGAGKITLLGLEGIPAGNQVVLVNSLNTSPVDMRRSNVYTYQTSTAKMQFKLIVGTKEYADGETAKLIPQAYELAQNYPNPFNPSTTISYMVPAGSYVKLEILSVIGERVRVLDEGYRAAATYSVIWDGKDENRQTVSSGVYFCRLVA